MVDSELKVDPVIKKILVNYPNKSEFIQESIKIFDRLLNFHIDIKGYYGKKMIKNKWPELISACHKSIDFIIQSSSESGYCKFEN